MSEKVATLNWEVEEQTLFLENNSKVESHKAIVRNDTNEVVSVMKKSYTPLKNEEFSERVEKVREISGFDMDGFSLLNGGAKVIAHLKNTGDTVNIGGHKLKDYMVLGNSHDGSMSFFIGSSNVYIWCQNQFSQIGKMLKIRHTKNSEQKIQEAYQYLDFYFNMRDEMHSLFNKFLDTRINEEIQENMINFVLGVDLEKEISARKQGQIINLRNNIGIDISGLGDNLWGLFNGVTRYTTHCIDSKTEVFGNLFGTKATINQKAFEFAKKELAMVV